MIIKCHIWSLRRYGWFLSPLVCFSLTSAVTFNYTESCKWGSSRFSVMPHLLCNVGADSVFLLSTLSIFDVLSPLPGPVSLDSSEVDPHHLGMLLWWELTWKQRIDCLLLPVEAVGPVFRSFFAGFKKICCSIGSVGYEKLVCNYFQSIGIHWKEWGFT